MKPLFDKLSSKYLIHPIETQIRPIGHASDMVSAKIAEDSRQFLCFL